ncbi:hypothetical protein [Sphingomonas albertensis]|uniref:Uncharacterized protein n=1 Tax=Sphingomonas albertensis TaxID=2762591 RepID=A0ABR7ARP1_9SPHN|nr:hypothetical protein [Sphingomonas albertensis]MBC3943115.1 hypothetical protein [Sphingomonas albertensis]
MSIDTIALRKALHLFYLKDSIRSTKLKREAKDELARRSGQKSLARHFHYPFWADAKSHAAGKSDLTESTDRQIERDWHRKNLYPKLRDGFLHWWNETRRWINEDIEEFPNSISGTCGFADIEGIVRVDNLMSLKVGTDKTRLIYPYFSDRPNLSEEAARIGLWAMSKALPNHGIDDMRILDVIRGETFSVDRHPLQGDEEAIFRHRYSSVLREWRLLLSELG